MALGPNQCHPQWNKWLYKPEMRQENQRWIISPYISTCTPGFFLGGILGAVVGVAMNMLKSQCISRSLRLFGRWRSLWSERGAWSHLGILMNPFGSNQLQIRLRGISNTATCWCLLFRLLPLTWKSHDRLTSQAWNMMLPQWGPPWDKQFHSFSICLGEIFGYEASRPSKPNCQWGSKLKLHPFR